MHLPSVGSSAEELAIDVDLALVFGAVVVEVIAEAVVMLVVELVHFAVVEAASSSQIHLEPLASS